jgi:uncharacterized protein (TIGR03435 family)
MAQFAEKAREAIWGDVDNGRLPVADLTGLTGAYDFAVTWAPSVRTGSAGSGGDTNQASGVPVVSTPNGELTFFEAVEKLGLKLQQQNGVDPIFETPS